MHRSHLRIRDYWRAAVFVNLTAHPAAASRSPRRSREFLESLAAQQTQIIQNLTATTQLAALSTPPVVNDVQNGIRLPPQPPPATAPGLPAGRQILPPASTGAGSWIFRRPPKPA